jgi:hypothetical protein
MEQIPSPAGKEDDVSAQHLQTHAPDVDDSVQLFQAGAVDDASVASVQFIKSIAEVLPDVTLSSAVLSAATMSPADSGSNTVLKRRRRRHRGFSVRPLALYRSQWALISHKFFYP